jgi:hypothetical protein
MLKVESESRSRRLSFQPSRWISVHILADNVENIKNAGMRFLLAVSNGEVIIRDKL